MNKKTLKVMGLVILVATLTFIFTMPVISRPPADSGTCCYQLSSKCVIGSVTHDDYYYLASGPCP